MATQVASIGVGKLSSTAKYVDTFIVELYSDSGYTIKIGQQTSTAQWNGSAWVQKDSIIFGGLVFGTTYYLRAAVIAPFSGALSSWSTFNTAAGSASAPGSTYSGTFVATTSGIGYIVTPASVPSDIDHFEAVWVWDSSTPASTTISYWSGQITNGTFNFFVGGTPGSTAKVYVRAVNTSQQAQGWQLIDTRAVSTTWSGVTTGTIGDGTLLGTGGPAVNSGSTGRLGIGGSVSSPFITAFGSTIATSFAGNSGYNAVDTTPTTGRNFSIYSGGSAFDVIDNTAAQNRLFLNSSGQFGIGMSPSQPLSVTGAMQSFGSNAALWTADRTSGNVYALYGTSNIPRLFGNSADFASFNPSTGAMGLGATYTGDWISIQGTPVIASDKNLYNQIAVSGKPRGLADVTDMSSAGQIGQNQAENSSFELPPNPGTGDLVAGWFIKENDSSAWTITQEDISAFTPASGNKQIKLSLQNSIPITAGATVFANIQSRRSFGGGSLKPGQKYWTRAKARTDSNVSLTAGLGLGIGLIGEAIFSDGTTSGWIGSTNQITTNGQSAWKDILGLFTVPNPPAGKTVVSLTFSLLVGCSNPTGGTLSTNSTGVPCDARFDSIEVIRVADTASDEVAKVGSTPPTLRGTMSYTSTTSSITWSWNLNIYRSDTAMTVLNVNSSQAVTGLLASTSYNFYPFYDEGTLSGTTGINMVATGGSGSPSWAHSGTNFSWTQEQSRSDHVPLAATPIVGSTTSSGSGGGSGGGDPTCLALKTLIKERTKGVITLEQVQVGDYLWSEGDIWLQVERKKVSPHDLWIDVEFGCNQIIESTAGHNWKLRDGEIKASHSLSLIDEIPCSTGVTHPSSLKLRKETQDAVAITLEAPHTFYACSYPNTPWVLTHNMQVSPC